MFKKKKKEGLRSQDNTFKYFYTQNKKKDIQFKIIENRA